MVDGLNRVLCYAPLRSRSVVPLTWLVDHTVSQLHCTTWLAVHACIQNRALYLFPVVCLAWFASEVHAETLSARFSALLQIAHKASLVSAT